MSLSKLIITASICALPLAAFSLPAFAATAHNQETGANSSNSNADQPGGAMPAKPMMMKKHMMHKKHMKHKAM